MRSRCFHTINFSPHGKPPDILQQLVEHPGVSFRAPVYFRTKEMNISVLALAALLLNFGAELLFSPPAPLLVLIRLDIFLQSGHRELCRKHCPHRCAQNRPSSSSSRARGLSIPFLQLTVGLPAACWEYRSRFQKIILIRGWQTSVEPPDFTSTTSSKIYSHIMGGGTGAMVALTS